MFLTLQMAVNTRRESSPPLYEHTSEKFLHYFRNLFQYFDLIQDVHVLWTHMFYGSHTSNVCSQSTCHSALRIYMSSTSCDSAIRVHVYDYGFRLSAVITAHNARLWCTFLVTRDLPNLYPSICLSGEISTRVRQVTTQHERTKTMTGMCDLKDNLDIQSCEKTAQILRPANEVLIRWPKRKAKKFP